MVAAQDSEILQHERVTNNSLLKTVNISGETFLKDYRVFMVKMCLVWTIHIVLFKFVFTSNRYQFIDAKTPTLFSVGVAPSMPFITELFRS